MQAVWVCVVDLCAVDFADERLVVPVEIVDAGACLERGLFGCVDVGDACAVSTTLIDFVDPQVVDRTVTRIFLLN